MINIGFIGVLFLFCIGIQTQVAPTWVTSAYLQAATKRVINGDACNCKTGSSSTPNASMTFLPSFPAPPNLGFGICNYQGDDYLGEEMFEINRTSLTASGFNVKMQISGFTHLWIIEVRYVAISKSFPHHLNSFDNVPINYTKGPLVGISTASAANTTYQNIVNYTTQATAAGSTYKFFSNPLTNNKVLLFMTSMFIKGTSDSSSSSVNNAINMYVSATPVSTQTYRLFVTLATSKAAISRLHFSMITFDQADVQASGQYLLVYDRIQFTNSGGHYPFPSQFLSNFMIGFTEFSSARCSNTIHFVLSFTTVSGNYGVNMAASAPRPSSPPIIRFNYTIFYLKTWTCPVNTVFNPSTNLCIACPLANCLTCFNLTHCSVCNQANNYFVNSSGLCQQCTIPGCITCTSLVACSDCNETLNYVLASNSCTLCQSSLNYFANVATQTCTLCTLSNCINCSSLTQCQSCNTVNLYYVGPLGTCQYCDPALNKLIDPVSKNCLLCNLTSCVNCSTLTTCRECAPGYLINATDSLCYPCTLSNCLTCATFTTCGVCNTLAGYTINTGTGQCQLCTLAGCITCTSTTVCASCNTTSNYVLLINNTCQQCSPGTFANSTTNTCDSCSLSDCITCLTLSSCANCNTSANYYVNTGGTCQYCDPLDNKFINLTSLGCQQCTIPQCTTCTSLTACSVCNATANYLLNSTDGLCYACPLSNCNLCFNFTACSICDTAAGFAINPATGLCEVCPLTGCSNCSDIATCVQCSMPNNYVLLQTNTCQQCAVGSFANTTSETCDVCIIAECTLCATLYSCSICNSSNSYYVLPGGTCGYCDPINNTFINLTSLGCQTCNLLNCLTCSSLTTCSVCGPASLYLLNSTDNLCYPCSLPNCLACYTLTNCSTCNTTDSYALNTATGLCEVCMLAGCTNCSSTTTCAECNLTANFILLSNATCQLCDAASNFFSNGANMTCDLCPLLPECQLCSSLTVCSSCNNAAFYYLTGSNCSYCDPGLGMLINTTSLGCQACNLSYCTNCSTLLACRQCDNAAGYFLNGTDNLCYTCAVTNCITCHTLTNCSLCDMVTGYTVNLATGFCELCALAGCNNCTNTLTCVECDTSTNFVLLSNATCQLCDASSNMFANETSANCQPCIVQNCLVCGSLTSCLVCDTNNSYYLLPNGTCDYCDPINNTFINSSSLQCEACGVYACLNCSSLTTCRQCDQSIQAFLNTTNELCQFCSISFCFHCSNLTTCSLCDESSQMFLNSSNGNCQPCLLSNCITCHSLTQCLECDHFNNYGFDQSSPNASECGPCNVSCTCDGYDFPWNSATQQCTPICGDGLIRLDEQCDDSNLISGDGCSSNCRIEIFFTCIGEPSFCNQTINIDGQFVQIVRDGCNSFKISVLSRLFSFDQISNNFFILNSGITITKRVQNESYIDIYAQYSRNIDNENILLDFWPGGLINITYNPSLPALYYNQEQCKAMGQVETMLQAVEIMSYVVLLVSLLSCKIVGLELFGVLQLSYFTLSSHDFLNVYLAPLAKFRTFNGLNIGITKESSDLPPNYTNMSVSGSFINNCNVMLFVLFAQLLVSLAVYIAGKIKQSQKVRKIGLRMLKQGFITLILFNAFNVSFSAGVHWKYAQPADQGYVISSIILFGTLAAMIISVVAMQLTANEDYGEFKKKFKMVWVCRFYIPLTVCYRVVLGLYTAVKSDYDESTLLILGFSLAFVMFFIINLPFTNVYQNYRGALIHISMTYTLLTTNYYRSMKSTTPMEVKGRIYTPAIIQLILMIACLFASFLVLVYQVYQIVKNCRRKNNKIEDRANTRKQTEQSFQTIQVN